MSAQPEPLALPELSAVEDGKMRNNFRVHEILSEFGGIDTLLSDLEELGYEEKVRVLNSIFACLYTEGSTDAYNDSAMMIALNS
jgi:hypothetical protein